ncbi:MAG: bifunctional precorrin-2 dehydrogenase/sirohydrochlorin ferrochelatase [Selenomonadaceae bacterium]|nr:bifunctional precorrin-2 dehydrogenase/sirohydrochlorin ferrochelatase [Selenomonadaceae bacterium]
MSYPINLDIKDKLCVVLGGGHVALRKINGLLNAGGKIVVIAPEICEELQQLVHDVKIEWKKQNYSIGCLPYGLIFIAATNDAEVNRMSADEATKKHMLTNIITTSPNNASLFTVPSVVHCGRLMITVSTDGLSPALSKCIRKYLDNQFNENFAKWLEQLSKIRDEVKIIIKETAAREEFWQNVMSNENFYLIQNGELNKAEVNIRNALDSYRNKS